MIIGATAYWANGVIEQKGMMRYGQTEWVPLHYCVFTLFCIVGGAMVYNEFEHLTGQGWVMFSCGGASCLLGVVTLTTPHRLVFATSPLSVHYEKQGDDYEHQTLDEKLHSLRLQRQSSRDVYSPGGSLANLGIEIIAEADSPSSRRSRLEDAHYPGSAAAARVTAVLAPEALPFESKLTKSSARLLGTRRAREPPFRRSPLPMRGPTRAASLSPHRRSQLSRCRSLSCPARVHAATHPHPP